MKYKEIKGLCKKCLGCNQLEDYNFNGKYSCNNFISDKKTKDLKKEVKSDRYFR